MSELTKMPEKMGEPQPGCSSQGNHGNQGKLTEKTRDRSSLNRQTQENNLAKSPSDTTLYAPALHKAAEGEEMINQISNFVKSMRVASIGKGKEPKSDDLDTARKKVQDSLIKVMVETPNKGKDSEIVNWQEAQLATESSPMKALHEQTLEQNISDDDFFHMICHINSNLKTKIEAGDYVDLEKLLPKDKTKRPGEE